ncbi:hypothetical protein QBC45DRAFT_397057 [Copromyces sp. CBS 386.78]|nr:hypothetical protein QBC45DRAFT_397057 [Copromyces sp. CBS 386.78]
MRIPAVESWLLATLSLASLAVSSQEAGTERFLTFQANPGFTSTPQESGGSAFIDVGSGNPYADRRFTWTSKNEVRVKSVSLYVQDHEGINSIGSFDFPNNKLKFSRADEAPSTNVNEPYPKVGLNGSSTDGSVIISNISELVRGELPGKQLFFEAYWLYEGKPGKSYSRRFTAIGPSTDQAIRKHVSESQLFTNSTPAYSEEFPVKDPPSGAVGEPNQSSSTTPTSTPQPTMTGSTRGNTGQNIGGGEKPNPQSDHKGLSIGAIIGIAIACGLLGLALIGGIVFFCLRRRQKQNALGGGTSRGVPYGGFANGGRNGGDELMAEKEANAGVIHDVTTAPTSPYSDDGLSHQQHLMGLGGAGASSRNSGSVVIPNIGSGVSPHGVVLPGVDGRLEGDRGSPVSNAPSHHMQQLDHQSGRSYTMYSDHQSGGGGGGSPTTLHSGADGAPSLTHGGGGTESNRGSLISQQQQGRSLSTPYAHLVEEGMTEEEIRRLEEEERQLDAAIEQHVGGQRGSRNLS